MGSDLAGPVPAAPQAPTPSSLWLKLLSGRLVQRICPSGGKPCGHERCHLRVLCQCAKAEFDRAAVLERRLWTVLMACGVAALAYWIIWP